MSRTDEVRGSGRERAGTGGGGGAPFVKWGDDYAWLEGLVTDVWEGKYGYSAKLEVEAVGPMGLTAKGRDEDGNEFTTDVLPGRVVNVGLASATLEGKITPDDVGKAFHVAFEGWEAPKGGNRYRVFAVVELTKRATVPPNDDDEPWPDEEPGDSLPF